MFPIKMDLPVNRITSAKTNLNGKNSKKQLCKGTSDYNIICANLNNALVRI